MHPRDNPYYNRAPETVYMVGDDGCAHEAMTLYKFDALTDGLAALYVDPIDSAAMARIKAGETVRLIVRLRGGGFAFNATIIRENEEHDRLLLAVERFNTISVEPIAVH